MKLLQIVMFFGLLFCLFQDTSQAIIKFEDAVFPEFATSGRALAMGNAYLCKVDDSAASFYNPAGLGTVRWAHLHLSNFHVEANKGWINGTGGGRLSDVGSNASKGFSLNGHRKLLLDNKGTTISTRAHAAPNFMSRYFSLGYLIAQRTRATMGKEDGDLFEYAFRRDYGPYVALNLSLFSGILKFGGSAIYLQRNEAIGEAPQDETFVLEADDINKGSAVIMTGGGRLTLPWIFLPTFAATIHNAAAQRFKGRGPGAPENIRQTIDVGFSLTPQIAKLMRVHLEVNYKDIGNAFPEVSTFRKVGLGMEFDFLRTLFVRFGYGDGYGSAGLGLRASSIEFDLTTYAVDTTSETFRGQEDRRFSMSVSVGF